MLDFVDEPLDQIALLVEVLVVRDGLRRERLDGMTACAATSTIEARKQSESKPLSAGTFSNVKPLIRPSA
jgi:hypothetical protein